MKRDRPYTCFRILWNAIFGGFKVFDLRSHLWWLWTPSAECPLKFSDPMPVAGACGCTSAPSNKSCCEALDSYLLSMQQQMLITNLQALRCVTFLASTLQNMSVSANIYSLCQIDLKDFSLQGSHTFPFAWVHIFGTLILIEKSSSCGEMLETGSNWLSKTRSAEFLNEIFCHFKLILCHILLICGNVMQGRVDKVLLLITFLSHPLWEVVQFEEILL